VKAEAHTYKVRPAYGSDRLLIEFGPSSSDKEFVADLCDILKGSGLLPKDEVDLVFLTIVHFDTPAGPLEMELDEWGGGFFLAEEDQDAIHFLDRILQESGRFRRESVNFEDYAQ
jgi:hypothetical protein